MTNHSHDIDEIIEIANLVLTELQSGYRESVYEEAMAIEFRERGIPYRLQPEVEIMYKGQRVGVHVLDFIVDERIAIELKAGSSITKAHKGQLGSYLHTTGLPVGLLINFPLDGDKVIAARMPDEIS